MYLANKERESIELPILDHHQEREHPQDGQIQSRIDRQSSKSPSNRANAPSSSQILTQSLSFPGLGRDSQGERTVERIELHPHYRHVPFEFEGSSVFSRHPQFI